MSNTRDPTPAGRLTTMPTKRILHGYSRTQAQARARRLKDNTKSVPASQPLSLMLTRSDGDRPPEVIQHPARGDDISTENDVNSWSKTQRRKLRLEYEGQDNNL